MSPDSLSALMLMGIIAAIGLPLCLVPGSRLGVLAAVTTGLLIRLTVGFLRYWQSDLADDAAAYDRYAQWLVLQWQGQAFDPEITSGKEGWSFLLAAIYRTVGHAPQVGILINVLAGTATIVVVAAICRELGWVVAVKPAAWMVSLWPVAFWWGALLLREAIITLLLALALLGAVRLRTGRFISGLIIILVTGFLMTYMRGGMAIVVLVVLPSLVGLSALSRPDEAGGKRRGAAGVAIGVIVGLMAIPYLLQRFSGTRILDSQRQATVEDALNRGATSFASAGVDPGNLPMSALQILTGPWPWAWKNLALVAAGFDAVLWICFYALAYVGWRQKKTNAWAVLLLVVPPLALALYLAQSGTNFGLIMRMRGMNLPFIVPLAALGWVYVTARKDRGRSTRHPNSRPDIPSALSNHSANRPVQTTGTLPIDPREMNQTGTSPTLRQSLPKRIR